MACCQRNHEVQALPPQRAHEPLTQGIGLRALGWSLQHLQTYVAHTLVEVPGEDRIPMVGLRYLGTMSLTVQI